MTLDVLIDFVIIALLGTTIAYAFTLNKKILLIHQNRDELKALLQGFNASLQRAETSIQNLKETSTDAIVKMQSSLKDANETREDLHFLVERGESVANKLEEGVRNHRVENVTPISDLVKTPISQKEESSSDSKDERIMSDVKKKLMGRLKTLK